MGKPRRELFCPGDRHRMFRPDAQFSGDEA